MEFTTVLFYVFSALLIFAALRVISASNPVHAALFLILSFFSAAAIWMLMKAEFLAIVLVLVYVGAVMVLFLFVVMMLDIDMAKLRAGFWSYLPLALTIGAIIAAEMITVLVRGFIAQEFEQVFPDLIDESKDPAPEGEDPYKSVRADLIPVLVKAIQEQQAIIDSLKSRLDAAGL